MTTRLELERYLLTDEVFSHQYFTLIYQPLDVVINAIFRRVEAIQLQKVQRALDKTKTNS